MKFDVIIGNPPFNDETIGTSDNPIYNFFLDQSYLLSEKALFITPARFLFNAGKTPGAWNRKMLSDEHLKVCFYEQQSGRVFPNTDIKGGVAITYRDVSKNFGMMETFTQFDELNSILKKVVINNSHFVNVVSNIFMQNKFDLQALYQDYPEYKDIIGSGGKERRLTTSIFEKLDVFKTEKNSLDDVEIIGLVNLKRVTKFINQKYLEKNGNLDKYKVILPKSNGSGAIGEVLSTPLIGTPLIGTPLIGYTQTFISIGAFDTIDEAENCLKYIKSKFARVMLGILKVTQDNNRETWKKVPIQNFTSNSDINWTKSIPEIDQQLYKKYSLNEEEINFIETKVKEMD